MAAAVKEAVSIPVIAANLIRSPEQAEAQLNEGIQDVTLKTFVTHTQYKVFKTGSNFGSNLSKEATQMLPSHQGLHPAYILWKPGAASEPASFPLNLAQN